MDDGALATNLISRVNVGDALTRSAAHSPDKLAVADQRRRLSFAELNAEANAVANALLGLGYRRGDALALASGNRVEFLTVYFACAKIGVVAVPLNLGWRADEIAYVLDHSEARGIVSEATLLALVMPAVDKVPAIGDLIVLDEPDAGMLGDPQRAWRSYAELAEGGDTTNPEVFVDDRDAVSYLYTSGTTSFPKGVVSSHLAVYLESLSVAAEAGFTAEDRVVAVMPLFHTAQLNAFSTPAIMVGAGQFLLGGFQPDLLLDLIEREKITRLFLLPMMYRALVERDDIQRRDFASLRHAAYAMTPMPDALLRRCLDIFGCDFYLAFGQTEMNPVATIFRPEHQLSHPGAVGTSVINVQVAIMSADGVLLPHGTEGEIVYRGPHVMTGYLKNPEATADAFAHGWFHSGDAGWIAEDGMLWFTDRYKDVIKSGGENVASIEVEKAIYAAQDSVAEVAVVGLPHPHWVEAITAVVVPKPGVVLDDEALVATTKQALASFKAPKAVIVAAELPKTATGKIQKNVLRQRYQDFYTHEPDSAG